MSADNRVGSWWAVAVVAVVGAALLLPGLGRAPFDDPGEGMHAEIAREILQTGDWVTLRLNGVRYFDKPPLLYWLVALGMKVSGPSEVAARIWPALGAIAAVAGTAFIGARLLGFRAGVIAGLALLSSAGFFAYGRYLRPETLFIAAISLGMGLILLALAAEGTHARRLAVGGCALLGVAALAKDPLGALGPLAAIALALALGRRLSPVTSWLPWSGVLALLVVGGLWYLVVALLNPGFLWYSVIDNHLLNAATARYFPDEDVPLTSAEFLAVAGLGAFPWIIPAALTVGSLVRRRAWRDEKELSWVALAVWTVGVFLLFALVPFKLPHYGLPAYPAIALLAARWWDEERHARSLLVPHLMAFALVALGGAWVYWSGGEAFMRTVFEATDVYTRKEIAAREALPLPPTGDVVRLVGTTALILGAGSLGILFAIGRRGKMAGALAVLATMLACMPVVGRALALVASSRSVKQMAETVQRHATPGGLLVHEGPIENSGALEMYSGLRPGLLDGRVSVLGFGATFPEAAGAFWERARLHEAWRGPQRVLLLTIRAPGNSIVSDLPRSSVFELAAGGGRWLYSNRP